MFIELAEILDCPDCADGFGLVAFTTESDQRRVTEGWLGCPMCETEFPIALGTISFSGEPVPAAPGGQAAGDHPMAVKLAALLGLASGSGSAVLLGPGLGVHAAAITELTERVEILAFVDAPGELDVSVLAGGVNPATGLAAQWPVRVGALDGVALAAPSRELVQEAARCLSSTRRLVVIDPTPDSLAALDATWFEELARDDQTWVGARR